MSQLNVAAAASAADLTERKAEEEISKAMESIPLPEKQAYLEAVQRAPHLFERECHPIKFVQACNYNVWEAARRMIKYWDERKSVFGERAFLPMTQTGDGALSPDDIVVLQAGFPVLIPDSSGKGQILFFDRRRGLAVASREAKLRCVLYLITVASEDVRARLNNLFVMVLLITPRVTDFDREFAKRCTQLFSFSPCRVSLHCLNCLPKGGKRSLLEQVKEMGTSIMANFFGHFQVHNEIEPGQLVLEMKKMGLTISSIPNSIGGTWKFEGFNQWCKDRAYYERGLMERIRPSPDAASVAVARPAAAAPAETPASAEAALPTDRLARKRLLNVMHSRQKRERRKMEMNNLLGEKHNLLIEQDKLQRENKCLGECMARALALVENIKSGQGIETSAQEAPTPNVASVGIQGTSINRDVGVGLMASGVGSTRESSARLVSGINSEVQPKTSRAQLKRAPGEAFVPTMSAAQAAIQQMPQENAGGLLQLQGLSQSSQLRSAVSGVESAILESAVSTRDSTTTPSASRNDESLPLSRYQTQQAFLDMLGSGATTDQAANIAGVTRHQPDQPQYRGVPRTDAKNAPLNSTAQNILGLPSEDQQALMMLLLEHQQQESAGDRGPTALEQKRRPEELPRAQPRAQQLSLEHGTGTDLNQLLSSLQSPESTSFTGSTIQQMLLQSRPQSQNRDHLTDLAHLVTSLKSQEAASLADIVPAAQSLQQSFLMPNGLQQQLQGQLTTPLNAIQQQLQGQLSSPFERIQQQQRLQSQLNSSSATPIRQPSSESAVQAQLLSQLTAARAPPQPQLSETTAALMLEALIRNSGTSNSSAPSQLQPQQQTHANSLSSLTAAAATGTSTAAAPQANAPRNSDLQMLLAWHNAQT